ncbi:GNAT family N-acetyltransferase [Paenibacillus sp. JNUCC31]|uniref:GNAT family N-acetyltransferase n=1 Tax=Paenibacillus sp. JNUCC-31 TaxID=2777983 RepID=UPI001782108B|nr:GNAT family N-acetyltransferase [Paenibacillus sp. JNUCC-31]QOS78621.1 GNAT family N-acetyltransferase [Paenibacillus sp. JNUCC-31]
MLVLLHQLSQRKQLAPFISGTNGHVVMGGVLAGLQCGRVYADRLQAPASALIWAQNEMFYLIGSSDNDQFNRRVREVLVQELLPEALDAGEGMLNLEVYPEPGSDWSPVLHHMFNGRLREGLRVPFQFNLAKYEKWLERSTGSLFVPSEYHLHVIDRATIEVDRNGIIQKEILKFWHSVDDFIQYGAGTCMVHQGKVVATCISVFVSGTHHETGIHTYDPIHRGKGLATAMASTYIQLVLEKGGTPHWTTEDFRHDSIVIAGKLGFEQGRAYPVNYMPIQELLDCK